LIVTLNPNTAIDYTLRIGDFELNSTIRADECAWGMGGKASDAAWILGKLGVPVTALGFAAGSNGKRMEKMLHERGINTDFVRVEGDTRLNVVIVRNNDGQTTITSPGLEVFPEHIKELTAKYQASLDNATCAVIGGSLPHGLTPEFYETVITIARQRNLPVIFDSSGPELVAGLKARPSLIKPNLDEITYLLGYRPGTKDEILGAVASIANDFGVDVILTFGEDGAFASLNKHNYWIKPLKVPIKSAAGAGDGVLAGLALAISRHEPLEKGLIYGFALAGAIVQTLATADFNLEDYDQLINQVEIVRQN
jgi:1-phosphofructokinase